MKTERGEESAEQRFEGSRGWFMRSKGRGHLHNIELQGEGASAYIDSLESAGHHDLIYQQPVQ
ncbi:hypothetical protein M514_23952 [Trichuris suis]|uniref:Uncharacterized protein n=1 Tax=Trichuris suis TaxID=68888 RepID=A0A085N2V8_9BILA|nr:hypothetical protein M514_23952 [Trichuris suis]